MDELVPQASRDALHAALAKQGGAIPPQMAGGAPPTPEPEGKAPEAPAEAPPKDDRARGPDGKFAPKETPKQELTPEAKGILAGLRAERERRKALEVEIATLKEQFSKREPEAPKPSRRDELLSKAPKETQDFWNQVADPVVDEKVNALLEKKLAEFEPYIADLRAAREAKARETAFVAELTEFVEEKALEGVTVDPVSLVETLNRFEKEHDISLGSTPRRKFENAMGLLSQKQEEANGNVAPSKPQADRKAEKARAGGVAPDSASTSVPPPPREALQTAVREAAWKGDSDAIARLIHARVPAHPLFGTRTP